MNDTFSKIYRINSSLSKKAFTIIKTVMMLLQAYVQGAYVPQH